MKNFKDVIFSTFGCLFGAIFIVSSVSFVHDILLTLVGCTLLTFSAVSLIEDIY